MISEGKHGRIAQTVSAIICGTIFWVLILRGVTDVAFGFLGGVVLGMITIIWMWGADQLDKKESGKE